MGGLLSFIVRGRLQAILVATLCLLLPLTSVFSGSVVALVTLRVGIGEGAFVLAATTAVASVITWLAFGQPQGVVWFALTLGAPLLLLGAVLRATASQGLALTAAGALGTAAIAVLHLGTQDTVAWWRGLLERVVVERVRRMEPPVAPEELVRIGEAMDLYAWMMSVAAVAWFILLVMLMLFLARWGHAQLDRPGEFGREFRRLRLDRRVAMASLAVGLVAWAAPEWAGGLALALLSLAMVLHLVQGVAVAHAVVGAKGLGTAWLAAMYLAMVFAPFVLALSVAGFSDPWMDWRRRLGVVESNDE